MIKKKLKSIKIPQFPKIYRFITERIKKTRKELRVMIIGFVIVVVVTLFLAISIDLAISIKAQSETQRQRQTLVSQVNYWQDIVKKEPGYRDGYFMLSVLEYQLRNFQQSKIYLDKVISIDPNFSPAIDFEKVLNSK